MSIYKSLLNGNTARAAEADCFNTSGSKNNKVECENTDDSMVLQTFRKTKHMQSPGMDGITL